MLLLVVLIVITLFCDVSPFLADETSSIRLVATSPAGGRRTRILLISIRLKLALDPLVRTVVSLSVLITIWLEVSVPLVLTIIVIGLSTLGSVIGLIITTVRSPLFVVLEITVILLLIVGLVAISIALVLKSWVIPEISSSPSLASTSVTAEVLTSGLRLRHRDCFYVSCGFVF